MVYTKVKAALEAPGALDGERSGVARLRQALQEEDSDYSATDLECASTSLSCLMVTTTATSAISACAHSTNPSRCVGHQFVGGSPHGMRRGLHCHDLFKYDCPD